MLPCQTIFFLLISFLSRLVERHNDEQIIWELLCLAIRANQSKMIL